MLEHPYVDLHDGQWLRGNLHAHTTRSDGKCTQQEVIDDYASRGYDFLMLSDHDVLTAEKDYAALNSRGLILIPGNEISANGPHLLHVNAGGFVPPHVQRQQVMLDAQAAGGFIIVAHPNWKAQFDHASMDQLTEWVGYVGMEIFNGVLLWHDGSPYATNKWDMMLAKGRRVWGFANDDSHAAGAGVGLGWNVALVRQRSVAGVIEALTSGRFYASTGVTIRDIRVEGRKIRIETENAQRIAAIQQTGKRLTFVDASSIELEMPSNVQYLRFECWGAGETQAWTQPFWNAP